MVIKKIGPSLKKYKRVLPMLLLTLGLLVVFLISDAPKAEPVSKSAVSNDNQYLTQLLACKTQPCLWKATQQITAAAGPERTLKILAAYQTKITPGSMGDPHEWAHIVGRQTAATYGVSGQSFLKCPTTFNYGCMHGFFEKALGQSKSAKAAIETICGGLEKNPAYSPKFKFYCYHGVGHGVMQSLENDLTASLNVCDSLDSAMGQDGCWQGVFMENINSSLEGDAQPGVFVADDALAPCDKVAAKYQHECYINHAAHLVSAFEGRVDLASAECLKAAPIQVSACLESIGLMVTNDTWQSQLDGLKSGDLLGRAWRICQKFPTGHVQSCVTGAVDQLLQMDELNVGRAGSFCQQVDSSYLSACFERIGFAVKDQANNSKTITQTCSKLAAVGRQMCLAGART